MLPLLLVSARGLFYDVLQPHQVPPTNVTCMKWSDAPASFNAFWLEGKPPANASNFCAQQAKGSAENPCVQSILDHGSICPHSYCIDTATKKQVQCESRNGVPEQINIQIASPDSVVIGWVTFESSQPTKPPVAMVGSATGTFSQTETGVTHVHTTAGGRKYYMHYVPLSGLTAKAKYYYKVKSGADDAEESDEFSFRAPYAGGNGPDGATRIALYGDMGVYPWNNMQNLLDDTVNNEIMDLIIHSGDHCYNEGDLDERRADGYMQAFEKTIANVPWMPIVGNHEFYGAKLERYLDQTWEKWGPIEDMEEEDHRAKATSLAGHTSATTSLGAFLAAGNHHAAATTTGNNTNSVPSNTSRYFSVDFGHTHLVALSLNGYNGVDTCTTECNEAQIKWLKEDLAAVDRSKTPWVIATSHFPFYLSIATKEGEANEDPAAGGLDAHAPWSSQPWSVAEACEYEGHSRNCSGEMGGQEWKAPQELNLTLADARSDLEPIFYEYGVDIYWAGHQHFYETFPGPVWNGKLVSEGTHNPNGVIQVCTGNGGPPSPSSCAQQKGWKTCIGQPYSYTRLTVYNATDLRWQQVSNEDNSILDDWVLHQDRHGPFPAPPSPGPTPPPAPTPAPAPVPLPAGFAWTTVASTAHESDLPAHAVKAGSNNGGGTYVCLVHPTDAPGENGFESGSVSYAGGAGHCRVATSNKAYYVTKGFAVLTAAKSFAWHNVTTSNSPADLPKGAVQSGHNGGGNTYICRVAAAQAGEVDLAGSVSYSGKPGHCRVATGGNSYYVAKDFEVMLPAATSTSETH